MKSALITLDDRQHIILQADLVEEERVLQMLKRRNANIVVEDSILCISREGELVGKGNSFSGDKAIVIKVLPPARIDPEVITMTKAKWLLENLTELRNPMANKAIQP